MVNKNFYHAASPFITVQPNDINLTHNTHLRHISLDLYWHEAVESEAAFTLLSQIISPLVDHVSLGFPDFCNTDWARLDGLLTQQRWANLQRLSVRRFPPIPGWCFPILESRGVVLDLTAF
jgi:hypothetical protein